MEFIVYLFISALIIVGTVCVAVFNKPPDIRNEFVRMLVQRFLQLEKNKADTRVDSCVTSVIPSHHQNPNFVTPSNIPLYVKRGWSKTKNNYSGYYRTRFGAWEGEINRCGDIFKVYIFNPPIDQIKKHSRWQCFHDKGKDKWEIDLAKNPKDGDVNAIISYVEKVLIESFCK